MILQDQEPVVAMLTDPATYCERDRSRRSKPTSPGFF